MKRILSIVLAVLFVTLAAASCKKAEGVEGTYIVKEMAGKPILEYMQAEIEEFGMSMDEYLSMVGMTSLDEFLVMTLNKDGTASVLMGGEEEASVGTWTQDGDKITLTIDGDPVTMTRIGSDLEFKEEDGQWYVFTKKTAK